MSEATRMRDQTASNVILRSQPIDTLEEAKQWGEDAYQGVLVGPFTPSAVGHEELQFWPAEDTVFEYDGSLDGADLEFGITINGNSVILDGVLLEDGHFFVVLHGNFDYAEKIVEAEAAGDEATTDGDGTDEPATEEVAAEPEAPASTEATSEPAAEEPAADAGTATEEAAADPDAPDAGTAGDEPPPAEDQTQGE